MTIKAHEFDGLVRKLGLVTRNAGDLLAWFEYEGKIITRTRCSKVAGDLPMQHSIRQQLKLTEGQLRALIGCRTDREGYVQILRNKGLI